MNRFQLAKNGLFQRIKGLNPSIEPETKLWRAVIDQTLHDLGSKDPIIQVTAEVWFDVYNTDFKYICDLADVNMEDVLNFIENIKQFLYGEEDNGPDLEQS